MPSWRPRCGRSWGGNRGRFAILAAIAAHASRSSAYDTHILFEVHAAGHGFPRWGAIQAGSGLMVRAVGKPLSEPLMKQRLTPAKKTHHLLPR